MFFSNTRYVFDVYALYDKIKNYEHFSDRISVNEISKWRYSINYIRNKYKHPLVLPNFVELKEEYKTEQDKKFDVFSQNSQNVFLPNN